MNFGFVQYNAIFYARHLTRLETENWCNEFRGKNIDSAAWCAMKPQKLLTINSKILFAFRVVFLYI